MLKRSSRWMKLELKKSFTSKERLYDQNIGEKLNEDDGERKKIEKPKNFGFKAVSLAIHSHERGAARVECRNWKVSLIGRLIVQSASFVNCTQCRLWHWISLFWEPRSRVKNRIRIALYWRYAHALRDSLLLRWSLHQARSQHEVKSTDKSQSPT